MEKVSSANYTIALRFLPHRLWYALGPGWAVIGAFLAAGRLQVQPDFLTANAANLAKLGLLWLLADPVLGTVWHLLRDGQLWSALQGRLLPQREPVRPIVPYTVRGSGGYRLAVVAARLKEQGGEGQSLLALVGLSLALAALLGWQAMLFAGVSLWLATWDTGGRLKKPHYLWQSVAQFLLPFWLMLILLHVPMLPGLLLGGAYWAVYLGGVRLMAGHASADRLLITGQGVAAMLLFALSHPIAGAVIMLSAIFSLLFRWAALRQNAPWTQTAAQWQLVVSMGYLAGALALGGWS